MRTPSFVATLVAALGLLATAGCPSCGTVYADRDGIVVEADVAYIDDGNARHKLDLYLPPTVDESAPVLVFFHGGYWVGQDKQYYEFASGLYGNVGVAFAREGFVVANCNYRLFPEAEIEDMLEDVDAAVGYVRERFPGAPIVLAGHSAGAHLAASAPLRGDGPLTRVDGLALWSGLYEIESAMKHESEENIRDIFEPVFGTTPAERAVHSVRDALRDTDVPLIFVTGENDLGGILVDEAALKNDRDDGEFVEIAGSDHADVVLQIASDRDGVTPPVVEFLRAL
jgi:pimeloyl-ACP methyl ester carboxylesterase